MLEAAAPLGAFADIVICAAAVADYAPAVFAEHKIKREEDGIDCIRLVKNPDIAATIGGAKRPGQIVAGFALETDNEEDNALAKLRRKHLDAIVLNSLRDAGAGFGTDTNKVTVITATGARTEFPLKSKAEVADDILDVLSGLKA